MAHVLIVDDEEPTLQVWRDALARKGHTSDCISDARAAQWALFCEPSHYDLILCDLALPGMSGKELLDSILPIVRDRVPIVVMSGFRHMIEALGEVRNGAFAVLPKPTELEDFFATVEKALRQRDLYQRLRVQVGENAELLRKVKALLGQNVELSKRVRVDALTGTANRVRLFEDLRTLDANRHRYGTQFAIGVLDIDDFGRFNKDHGLETGDEVLRCVACAILDACRRGDVIYRFGEYQPEAAYRLGGDEFVLILAAQDEQAACVAMKRILMRVEEATTASEDQIPDGPVTVSVGVVANSGEELRVIGDLLQIAGDRLNEAKRRGGNCCVCGGDSGHHKPRKKHRRRATLLEARRRDRGESP